MSADLWADLRGVPLPAAERCGLPRLGDGKPCRNERDTCRWHGAGRGAVRARQRGTGIKHQPRGFVRAVPGRGPSEYEYASARLRRLNPAPAEESDDGPDGDGGEPMPEPGSLTAITRWLGPPAPERKVSGCPF